MKILTTLFLSIQEENKILDKTNRQKIFEVEKLSQTIAELEEAILAGGAAANTLCDYKRRISELQVRIHLDTYLIMLVDVRLCDMLDHKA